MFTIEHHVGRLLEARPVSPLTNEEIEQADATMGRCVEAAGGKVIICGDYRWLTILPAKQATSFVDLFRRYNQYILFSAILVDANSAVSVLQMERVIREAASPARQCFRSVENAREWLEPYLTPEELARLVQFLATMPPGDH